MKITRLSPTSSCKLWQFFSAHLPSSLRAAKLGDGYGTVFAIEVKNRDIGSYFAHTGIATVWDDAVELRHPEYYSDFEDLIKKYEAVTGKEVEFRYWSD